MLAAQDEERSLIIPSAKESEEAVIATLLYAPGQANAIVAPLEPGDFRDPLLKRAFQAFVDLCALGLVPDAGLVAQHVRQTSGNSADWVALNNLALDTRVPLVSLESHVRMVKDAASKRTALLTLSRLDGELRDPSADTTVLIAEAIAQLRSVHAPRARAFSFAKAVDDTLDAIVNRPQEEPSKLGSGIAALDSLVKLRPNKVVVIGARPGVGKSALAMNIVSAASQAGASVAVFNCEMGVDELIERMLSSEANVNGVNIRDGLCSAYETHKLKEAAGNLRARDVGIWGIDSGIRTVSAIEERVASKQGAPYSLVVVDYIQLLHARRKSDNRVAEISEITRDLKQMSADLGVCVVALAQLNRETIKRTRPLLADLRDSGSIESDSDAVILIHRPDMQEVSGTDDAELIVAKNRNGALGTVQCYFRQGTTSFISEK